MMRTQALARVVAWGVFACGADGLSAGIAEAQVPGTDTSRCGTARASEPPPSQSPAGQNGAWGLPGPAAPLSPLVPTPKEAASGTGLAGGGGSTPTPSAGAPSQTTPDPPQPGPLPGLPPAKGKPSKDESRPRIEAIQATGEVSEESLLDVGVQIFDAAGTAEVDREKLAKKGLSPELRRAEGRYVALHLKKTLESTGNWGAVRAVPGPGEGLDLLVSGRILESNGKRLELAIEAIDATGTPWLKRRYRGEANRSAYLPDRLGHYEAFQEVYNRVANDLLAARDALEAKDLVNVRRVAALRFGSQLSPEAFAAFLKPAGSGRYELVRLPAEDDPMAKRVAAIRERDQMLVDTLNEHYVGFYERMQGPYATWRMYSYQEQEALDKINRESRLKKILGGAAVLAGMFTNGSSQGGRMASDVAIIGGMAAIQAGFRQAQEAGIHVAALTELATSFDGEVAPLLVELEGQQLKLSGSAETQFAAWRELLHRVFSLETGVPGDPNAVTVAPPSSF